MRAPFFDKESLFSVLFVKTWVMNERMRLSSMPIVGDIFRFAVLADPSGLSKNALRNDCVADMTERFGWDDDVVAFAENRVLGQAYKKNWEKRATDGYLSQDEITADFIVEHLKKSSHEWKLQDMGITDLDKFAQEICMYGDNIGAANRIEIAQDSGGDTPHLF